MTSAARPAVRGEVGAQPGRRRRRRCPSAGTRRPGTDSSQRCACATARSRIASSSEAGPMAGRIVLAPVAARQRTPARSRRPRPGVRAALHEPCHLVLTWPQPGSGSSFDRVVTVTDSGQRRTPKAAKTELGLQEGRHGGQRHHHGAVPDRAHGRQPARLPGRGVVQRLLRLAPHRRRAGPAAAHAADGHRDRPAACRWSRTCGRRSRCGGRPSAPGRRRT